MLDRPTRLKNFFLSPGVSIIVALIGLFVLITENLPAALLSAGIGALMAYNIKARTLFRGQNYPFVALFVSLQASTAASAFGSGIALFFALALTVFYLCFMRQEETKTFYLIFLVCGLGALWSRSCLLIAPPLLVVMALMRAFSMRGLVAAILGVLTPAIILGSFGQLDVFTIIENYIAPFEFGISDDWIFSATIALFFALVMFLPSYGYPAEMRARNMSMLGLTVCAIVLPCVDFLLSADYMPLLNLCAAYNVSHFAGTRRFGWIGALLVLCAAVVFRLFWS